MRGLSGFFLLRKACILRNKDFEHKRNNKNNKAEQYNNIRTRERYRKITFDSFRQFNRDILKAENQKGAENMTPTKEKALIALLDARSKKEAAKNAGISARTLNKYLQDPEFIAACEAASGISINSAARQAQQTMTNAIKILQDMATDKNESGTTRTAAASALLDFALRLSEKQHSPVILSGNKRNEAIT